VGRRKHALDRGPDPPCEGAIFMGKDMSGHVRQDSAMSCAKTTEQMERTSGLWARVGSRNHVLDGVQIPPCERAIFMGQDKLRHAQ